tara:strand:+ start:36697 stop:46758 length:10062 start_codon:yes stop_codon:yes gene_type:complete
MSIKKLFDSVESNRNYLSDRDQKDAFKDVESERNLEQLKEKQSQFVPQVDYSEPFYFAKFGSAHLYYKGAMQRITDYYPYDGSDAEINEFYNKLLDVEKYVFDNLYPRTNGYANLGAASGDATSSVDTGYAVPSTKEYIELKGGPHALSSDATLVQSANDPLSSKFQHANIYDTDIYTTEGLPSGYGVGTRQSNLQSNFDTGVSIEFWLKKPSFKSAGTAANKETIFDLWTSGSHSSSADYGRITLEITGGASGSPFLLTAQSGTVSASVFQQSIGQNITTSSLGDWRHIAFVLYNTGSDFVSKLYYNGVLNDTNTVSNVNLGQLKQKDTFGRIGALLTAPSGITAAENAHLLDGASKLSASIDEFRFWKEKRSAQDIGRYWFTQVRGGTNTDIANTTLGVYYKFNEGITGTSATDSNVLDYAGRITNGSWTGYGTNSRTINSAIVEASASSKEYKDPIIHSAHSDVVNLKTLLLDKGSWHDSNNSGLFMNYAPSWVLEEHDNSESSNLATISHIVGAYFDRIYLLAQQIPRLKGANYPTASAQPIPFAQHLPQSLGLYMPEIFIDANVMEKFLSRNENSLFENELDETKNLIYLNLYNNLTNIFKSKGTEKALRNVLRCFNIDEKIIKVNTYARNTVFPLNNNYEQIIEQKKFANFAKKENRSAVIYQADLTATGDAGLVETSGYISASTNNYERNYGATIEAEVMFPYWSDRDYADDPRNYTTVSLFGMTTPRSGSMGVGTDLGIAVYAAGLSGSDTTVNFDENEKRLDYANFTVRAIKPEKSSKHVYFELSSSEAFDQQASIPSRNTSTSFPFPTLTSSIFFDVYDNSTWNLSVRIKPKIDAPVIGLAYSTIEEYEIVFEGRHVNLGSVEKSFSITGSVQTLTGSNFLSSPKRLWVGAQRTNLTGALIYGSDVFVNAARYWAKYLDSTSLSQHGYDIDNYGISDSYQNVGLRAAGAVSAEKTDILNLNTLALNWNFEQVTSSNAAGNFAVSDISSGSALLRDNYGDMGGLTGYQHTGYGYGFQASDTAVVKKKHVNTFKFIEPERATSADAVQILSEDDKVFGLTQTVPNYVYTIEKSMYRAISEEMLDFFAGVVDFNNVIGEPVNRYRERYKSLEKLREIFFRKVTKTSQVEKFVEYYKWFDDAISIVMGQLVPASSDFVSDVYNTVESHVLERNKYQTKFPTLESKAPGPMGALYGEGEIGYVFRTGTPTLRQSPARTDRHIDWWLKRAERDTHEITSGDSTIDTQREKFRKVINSSPVATSKRTTVSTAGGTEYKQDFYAQRNFQRLYKLTAIIPKNKAIHGGVNFESKNMNIGQVYNALYPFGPVNREGGKFVPLNVLFGLTKDLLSEKISEETIKNNALGKKVKRILEIQAGRNWEGGTGYYNRKSTFALPFNLMSSSVYSGYNKEVVDGTGKNIEIVNLHNDVYGPDSEVPIQGPFTERYVGGHQSRHVSLNQGSDTYKTRPEAWKLLLGQCVDQGIGAVGMAAADYPHPDIGAPPAPSVGAVTIAGGENISAGNYVTIGDGDSAVKFEVGVNWTAGANGPASATNLRDAINVEMSQLNISATTPSVPAGADVDIVLANTRYGVSTSTKRGARGSLGNVTIVKSGGNLSVSGMSSGTDPVIMNHNAPRATYFREPIAKRPVNIRNIQTKTGSTGIGNYQNNYELVNTVGAFSNPRVFVKNQPTLPTPITSRTNLNIGGVDRFRSPSSEVVLNYLTRNRTSASHFDFGLDYMVTDNSGAYANKSVITSRFGAPGSRETMARGFQEVRSSEFSVYNTIPWRNLTVLEYGTNERAAGTQLVDGGSGTGSNSYVVNDIHNRSFGLRQHLQRHNKQFGRDPEAHIGAGGASYDEKPAMFKTNRNPLLRIKEIEDGEFVTQSQFDNYWVQHQIPRSDRQYAWITASLANLNNHFRFLPADYLFSGSTGYVEPYTFVTASNFNSFFQAGKYYWGQAIDAGAHPARRGLVPTDFAGINFNLYEPISSSTNIVGYPAGTSLVATTASQYRNTTMIFSIGIPAGSSPKASAYMFNALMLHRNGPYGWPTWKQVRYDNPITRNEYKTNKISVNDVASATGFKRFNLSPVTMRGRVGKINADTAAGNDFTAVATHNNVNLWFQEPEADDHFGVNYNETSPLEEVINITYLSDNYSPNWFYTAQNLFPSKRNEFLTRTRERTGYSDFYSSNVATRVSCGHTINNSFNLRDYNRPRGGVHIVLTQSCWPLDPPSSDINAGAINWATRTAPAIGGTSLTTTYSDGAGELQNSYVMPKMPAGLLAGEGFSDHMIHGLLYSRKQTLGSINSVRSAYGPSITVHEGVLTDGTASVEMINGQAIDTFAGEAKWQAGPQAGIVRLNSAGDSVFTSYPSEPAIAYSDFKYEPKLIAKDYGILPEFRLSEHIEKLQTLGLVYGAPGWAEIAGTGINGAVSSSFYLDYSNTEFLETYSNFSTDMKPTEFMLKMDVVKRFLPYKGFYPAQRTQQLVSQFSSSYFNSFMGFFPDMSTSQFTGSYGDELLRRGGTLRPILASLFAPGVLYNSIKSGMAVDYPILTDLKKVKKFNFIGSAGGVDGEWDNQGDGWALTIDQSGLKVEPADNEGYAGGEFWDLRVPFDGIIKPEKYLLGLDVVDSEPHRSCSLNVTASLIAPPEDQLYSKMTSNFLAETMNFFLEKREPTELTSRVIADSFTFETGSTYTARLKLRRSTAGSRNYAMELDSRGFSHTAYSGKGTTYTSSYGLFGANNIGVPGTIGYVKNQEYSLPQDPIRSVSETSGAFRETFTMYSRPSAFGPPVAALRPTGSLTVIKVLENTRDIKDSFNGFYWSHTPPYTNGDADCDLIFQPRGDKTYTLPTILEEVKVVQRRFDPGHTGSLCFTGSGAFRPSKLGIAGGLGGGSELLGDLQGIYGINTNFNAMQLSASINPLGIRRVQAYDGTGETSGILGYQMVVRPHWESPHNNFNSVTATLPLYASASVPKGIWHQFGALNTKDTGVYLEIDDIPQTWLKNHYDVIWNDSVYNSNSVLKGKTLYKTNNSLIDLLGFRDTGTSVKLGEYAESRTLREAVVAIPYIIEQNEDNYTEILDSNVGQFRKKFINIPKDRWEEAVNNPDVSEEAAGRSILKLKKQMKDYILPPQFDFLHNKNVDPIVMFMFEFEYKLDKDDLSYIWQNLAPRNHKQITRETAKIAFELGTEQLLSQENITNNKNMRWMVFKIKQRSQKLYDEYVISKPGEATREEFLQQTAARETGYKLAYNWPYDYVSFVEMARMDAQILYGGRSTGVPGERVQRNLDYTSPVLETPGRPPAGPEGAPAPVDARRPTAGPPTTSKRTPKRTTKQTTKKRSTRRMPGTRRGRGGSGGGGKGY